MGYTSWQLLPGEDVTANTTPGDITLTGVPGRECELAIVVDNSQNASVDCFLVETGQGNDNGLRTPGGSIIEHIVGWPQDHTAWSAGLALYAGSSITVPVVVKWRAVVLG